MDKRRPLAESLPPDAQEFLRGGVVSKPTNNQEIKSVSQQVNKQSEQQDSKATEEGEDTIPITVRFPASIVKRLRTVTTSRKNAELEPYTQQGILLQACVDWLKKHD